MYVQGISLIHTQHISLAQLLYIDNYEASIYNYV